MSDMRHDNRSDAADSVPSAQVFTDAERAVFAAWQALEVPPMFAARVLERFDGQVRQRQRWFAVGAMAALLVVGFFGLAVASGRLSSPSTGATTAIERTTVALGRRATAVLEPGASVSWDVDLLGRALVRQSSGSVFYRVQSGGAFVVATPAGEVRVTGTCFRVEVESMKASHAGMIGTAAAAVAYLAVFEGRGVADTGSGSMAVLPGDSVKLERGRAPISLAADQDSPASKRAAATQGGTSEQPNSEARALLGRSDSSSVPRDADPTAELSRLNEELPPIMPVLPATEEGLRDAAHVYMPGVAECLKAWNEFLGGFVDDFRVSFRVVANEHNEGVVQDVVIVDSTANLAPLEGCVANVFANLRFEAPSSPLEASRGFHFKMRDPAGRSSAAQGASQDRSASADAGSAAAASRSREALGDCTGVECAENAKRELTDEDVVAGVKANAMSLARCVRAAIKDGEVQTGREYTFTLDFVIAASGSVREPRLKGPAEMLTTSLPQCFEQAMRQWRFAASANDTPVVDFPLGPIHFEG